MEKFGADFLSFSAQSRGHFGSFIRKRERISCVSEIKGGSGVGDTRPRKTVSLLALLAC